VSALNLTQANLILNATLAVGGTNTVGATTGMKLRLTSTAPTGSSSGTELSATGYTAGGTACGFASASAGATAGPTGSAISWTNSGSSSWTGIVGLTLFDEAGTPVYWYYGTWSGQPIVIAAGNSFQVAVSAVSVGMSLYVPFYAFGRGLK
jgi:hypothetical protein